ncbi:hypothetical protein LX15_001203 [Streptoalloteichus tenebrarius]|uniref:Uncharacterized protein n=1 Tax=Streptoalloteichus tenebrarius (strain ATCC 17920 / DSM 40477 / JCM 4838 / CBS 697.72 / NBRC 16177 / NCIMB 11028 / NRRL B-12390 / A12253. 1 / ISP 5477) TaxID=1933 RepID=A0ABT1HPV1_STRSD|nr:hypothetical protein [Streptoalloteichus tenebrarius]MCP2257518.1 hypothetical protein [Streptoalloteichus tenebrarius]BFE98469.1 hypothetical protein GCM10020241_01450 [Streptoalloteichus tenebrarius]
MDESPRLDHLDALINEWEACLDETWLAVGGAAAPTLAPWAQRLGLCGEAPACAHPW